MNPTTTVLTSITLALQLVNAAEPDIAAIVRLFKNTSETLQQYLDDADKTENAEIAKIKSEMK